MLAGKLMITLHHTLRLRRCNHILRVVKDYAGIVLGQISNDLRLVADVPLAEDVVFLLAHL